MSDATEYDIALFMSAYVQFHTEVPEDGSYIPMTEEEAQAEFLGFVSDLQAAAWEDGRATGQYYGTRAEYAKNPYRTEES